MQPFNPFLRSFFASKLPAQCSPASHFVCSVCSHVASLTNLNHQVLLVPTTEFLLAQTDTESQLPFSELAQNEDFLSSHVLRIPSALMPGGGPLQSIREGKAKTKQYNTLNGRTVVVKDNSAYSNKGETRAHL